MSRRSSRAGGEDAPSGFSDQLQRLVAWALAGLLILAPLAIGGSRAEAQLALCGVALVLLALGAWARLGHSGLRLPWPLWGPLVLVVLGLLQLLPLPAAVVGFLSPRAHEVLSYSLGDLGLYGESAGHALSLDPPATWVATFHQIAFAAVALVAANVSRQQRWVVERALVYGGALVALVGLVHWACGAEQIYGAYEALDRRRLLGYFSTFVNNNTLAGYLVLGTLAGLGLAVETQDTGTQRRALAGTALCAAGAFLSGSRGGQVALVLGLGFFFLLAHAPGAEPGDATRERARLGSRVALGLGLAGLVLALLLLPDWTSTQLAEIGADPKLRAWPDALTYGGDFWATGSGRGTFAYVYPQYQSVLVSGTVSHPENVLLQLLTEWGVFGALIALVCGVGAWLTATMAYGRQTRPRHWGLVAGLGAAGLQQLVDFGFEAAGLSLPIAAALGLSLARAAHTRPRGWNLRRPRLAPVALILGLLLAGLLAWQGPPALARQADRAAAAVDAAPANASAVLEAARAGLVDHPADYLLPLATAARLVEVAPEALGPALRWVNRALFLFPHGGRTHLLAARTLVKARRLPQAATEYRAALTAMPWLRNALMREVVASFRAPDLLLRAVPADRPTHKVLATSLLEVAAPARARATLEALIAEDPDDGEARAQLARACLKLTDAACAGEHAQWLVAHDRAGLGRALHARVALQKGDAATARAELAAGKDAGKRDRLFLRHAAEIHLTLRDAEEARAALDALWPLVAFEPGPAASTLALRGLVEARLGDTDAAQRYYERAFATDPRASYALSAASAARRAGRAEAAQAILTRAVAQLPDAAALKAALVGPAIALPASPASDADPDDRGHD